MRKEEGGGETAVVDEVMDDGEMGDDEEGGKWERNGDVTMSYG